MFIEAKFKTPNDKIADYEVSLEGQAPVPKGRGEYGRSQAASALAHYSQMKAQKDKYLKALQLMDSKAKESGSLSVQNDLDDGAYFSAIIDGDLVFEGYDIDELNVRLSRDREPSEDRREPGF